MELDAVEGRQGATKGDKPELEPVAGRQRETSLAIMIELDPVEGRQTETEGDKA